MGRTTYRSDKTNSDEAENNILKGVETPHSLKTNPDLAKGYLFLGELYADRGRKEEALDNLTKAEGMFREMGMDEKAVDEMLGSQNPRGLNSPEEVAKVASFLLSDESDRITGQAFNME